VETRDAPVMVAHYRVKDDDGQTHDCSLYSFRVVKVPERGTILNLWFAPIVWMPNPPIYGPYLYGLLDDKVVEDSRLQCLTEHGLAKLEQTLARALGMRYQTTPMIRLGGDAGERKIYTRT